MPHSSGGGSSGGGFHGGSSGGFHGSSGSNSNGYTPRYSRTMFTGAMCYVYYRNRRPEMIYTNEKPSQSIKRLWISLIVKIVLLVVPIFLVFLTSFHFPKKLNTNYDTEIIVTDNINVLSDEEETNIKQTFTSFFETTGITPCFMTVDDYTWTLEDYAYNTYVKSFNDEKHWLIIYYRGERGNWQFEGMQGNDTDTIISSNVSTKFNKEFYNRLSDGNPVGESLAESFDAITPHIMDNYFYMETGIIIFTSLWGIIFSLLIVSDIINMANRSKLKNATLVKDPNNMVLAKCPYCDTEYYANTIKKCIKCGAELPFEDTFSEEGEH